MNKQSATTLARRAGKKAMTSDAAYRVEAKKGGKMNAGLKAYLAKKKKKKGKK
jgi:hypothetical protein